MSTQVARIGGQLLQDNLLRELADLQFDNDPLFKRDTHSVLPLQLLPVI